MDATHVQIRAGIPPGAPRSARTVSRCPRPKIRQLTTHAGNTASGNEAVLECSTNSFCCDTSSNRFSLDNRKAALPIHSPSAASSIQSSPTGVQITSTDSLYHSGGAQPSSDQSGSSTSPLFVTTIGTQPTGGVSTTPTTSQASNPAGPGPQPPQTNNPTSNIATILGPAIGIPLGILILILIAFLLRRRRLKQQRNTTPFSPSSQAEPMYKTEEPTASLDPVEKPELEGSSPGLASQAHSPRAGYERPQDVGFLPSNRHVSTLSEMSGSDPSAGYERPGHLSELPAFGFTAHHLGE